MALDRLLQTVTDVAKDLRDESTRSLHETTLILSLGAIVIAISQSSPATRGII